MLLIKNGKILTMAGKSYDKGDILIDGKIIRDIGENLSCPEGTEVIDAGGMWVMPGMVDPHCHIGMWEDGMGFEGADGNEMTDPGNTRAACHRRNQSGGLLFSGGQGTWGNHRCYRSRQRQCYRRPVCCFEDLRKTGG